LSLIISFAPGCMQARELTCRPFRGRSGLDDRDDEERVAPGEVAVEPVAQEKLRADEERGGQVLQCRLRAGLTRVYVLRVGSVA
jgi:hypothetical protein